MWVCVSIKQGGKVEPAYQRVEYEPANTVVVIWAWLAWSLITSQDCCNIIGVYRTYSYTIGPIYRLFRRKSRRKTRVNVHQRMDDGKTGSLAGPLCLDFSGVVDAAAAALDHIPHVPLYSSFLDVSSGRFVTIIYTRPRRRKSVVASPVKIKRSRRQTSKKN